MTNQWNIIIFFARDGFPWKSMEFHRRIPWESIEHPTGPTPRGSLAPLVSHGRSFGSPLSLCHEPHAPLRVRAPTRQSKSVQIGQRPPQKTFKKLSKMIKSNQKTSKNNRKQIGTNEQQKNKKELRKTIENTYRNITKQITQCPEATVITVC